METFAGPELEIMPGQLGQAGLHTLTAQTHKRSLLQDDFLLLSSMLIQEITLIYTPPTARTTYVCFWGSLQPLL